MAATAAEAGTSSAAPAGAWVRMPADAWLAVARLESHRQQCLLVADASSLTPAECDALAAQGVLPEIDLASLRSADGDFAPPPEVPHDRLLALTPAGGPGLAAWWDGSDLAPADAVPTPSQSKAVVARAADRARLLLALAREGLLPPHAGVNPVSVPTVTPAFVLAVQTWLARSAAAVVLVRLADCLGAPAAGPGGRLVQPLERLRFDDDLVALQRALALERGSAPRRAGAGPLRARIPRATYRLQLHRGFDLPAATELVPYLAALGISHVYCSPLLRARPGSQHGYDVVDHGQINPEIGSRSDLQRLVESLRRHGMGLVLDIVPNHMGVLGGDNAWWLDVLENGPASAYAEHFDIDWQAADPALTGRVLVPVLGEQYGAVLDRGELQLVFDAASGRLTLRYHEHQLPIDPVDYAPLIRQALQALPAGALDRGAMDAVSSLADAFEHLPPRQAADEADRTRRQRDKRVLKAQLAQFVRTLPPLAAALDDLVVALNGRPGARDGFDALDALIGRQAWRLAHWRVAGDEINYRRFFDINDLAALRMERAEVFEATHRLVLQWLADGWIDGLRIDHSDGLADPAGYFARLQQRHAEAAGAPAEAAAEAPRTRPLYLVTEKITAPHESMPADWAVHGTTGYDFANLVNNLLIDADAKARLDRGWRLFAGDEAQDFEALAWRCRQLVMEGALAGDLTVLAGTLLRLAREDRHTRDFTLNTLRRALVDVIAAFPVYRTYVVDRPSAQDRRFFNWALGRARRLSRVADASVFDFLRRVLLGRPRPGAPPGQAERLQAFVRRFQQVTAPVAAKGLEDTALYRHHRLISVNDVGGEPDEFGCTVAAFHAATRERARHWPHGMLATSTHDAKRSEDVRARIDVISEMPAAWRLLVRRWSRLNRRHKRTVRGRVAPTRNDEYLLYQTLAGCYPATPPDDETLAALAGRVAQAMLKSAREAKLSTAWVNPDVAYEAALTGFVHALLTRRDSNLFLPDLEASARVFGWHGALNGLTLAAVKMLSPGVPDIYQGHEGIELSLVDPDNRRPVDFGRRAGWLAEAQQTLALPDRRPRLAEWLHGVADGRAKFWTLWRALDLRRTHEALLTHGDYLPLEPTGGRARHLVAFARQDADGLVLLVAGRLTASLGLAAGEPPLGAVWGDTAVVLPPEIDPGAGFDDAISGERHAPPAGRALAVSALLAHWPAALLVRR
jgi:(1->4)-alpha-D-glucan 1-alpha-D-glucosylmutase